jgi:hypothetical protein
MLEGKNTAHGTAILTTHLPYRHSLASRQIVARGAH